MRFVRACAAAAVLTLSLGLAACSSDTNNQSGGSANPSAPASAGAAASASPTVSGAGEDAGSSESTASASPAPKTTKDQPVPKVQRSGQTGTPTNTAKPASTGGTVKYRDGVSLRVLDVSFAKETSKGPGSFPGRQFAVLSLQISNKSAKAVNLDTTVITVLDKNNKPVAPVYAEEAKAQDFSGTLKSGKTTNARYAFAVPKSSRSGVTVVVDFDGVHTSAVFRGKLS